jgi:DNA-3-methyladenine glycosylase I
VSKFIKKGADGIHRCGWCGADPLYIDYHDSEWGVPQHDDQKLFEKICLEGFQAGLSWITILRKRESFRKAFHNFEIGRVARFTTRHVEKLLTNEGIVRHRGKIEAVINNANAARDLQKQSGTLDEFFWSYRPAKKNKFDAKRAVTPESIAMSKELRRHGWKFVGPTTCYSFMQAMGIVNDHHPDCFRYRQV